MKSSSTGPRVTADSRQQHDRAIAALVAELERPVDLVRRVYEIELQRIQADARLSEYVFVFVRKSAKECLICEGRVRRAKCAAMARCPMEPSSAEAEHGGQRL